MKYWISALQVLIVFVAFPTTCLSAPSVVSCVWSNMGNGVTVTFNQSIAIYNYKKTNPTFIKLNNPVDCTQFLIQAPGLSSSYSGTGDCTAVVSGAVMSISFKTLFLLNAGSTAVGPGKSLYFMNGVITDTTGKYTWIATSDLNRSVVIATPANPILPSVSLTYASSLPNCAPLVITVSTSGDSGRPFSSFFLNFTSYPSAAASTIANLTNGLVIFFNSVFARNTTYITLDQGVLFVGNYTMSISVTNVLGGQSTSQYSFSRLADFATPAVSFTKSFVDLAKLNAFNFIAASVSISSGCSSLNASAVYSYAWSQVSGPSLGALNVTSSNSIGFKPFTLRPNTLYTLVLTISIKGQGSYQYPVQFTTESNKLSILLSGGIVSLSSEFYISAPVQDSATTQFNLNTSNYACDWVCQDLNGNPCLNQQNATLVLPITFCYNVNMTGLLDIGNYTIIATATSLSTGAVSPNVSAVFNVVNLNPPIMSISASTNANPSVNAQQFFLIVNVQQQSIPNIRGDASKLNYVWSMSSTCAGNSYPSLDITSGNTTVLSPYSGVGQSKLVLKPSAFSAGFSYCFTVTANDPSSPSVASGYAYAIVTFRQAPSSGTCSFGTTQPVEFNVPLSVTCYGYITDAASAPLQYQFFVTPYPYPNGVARWTCIGALSSSSSANLILPAGTYQVYAYIVDGAGSFITYTIPSNATVITVAASLSGSATSVSLQRRQVSGNSTNNTTTLSAATSFLNSSYAAFNVTGDISSGLSDIGSALACSTCANDSTFINLTSGYTSSLLTKLTITTNPNPNSLNDLSTLGASFGAETNNTASASVKDQLLANLLTMINFTIAANAASGFCASDATIQTWYSIVSSAYTNTISDNAKAYMLSFFSLMAQCLGTQLQCSQSPVTFTSGNGVEQNVFYMQPSTSGIVVGDAIFGITSFASVGFTNTSCVLAVQNTLNFSSFGGSTFEGMKSLVLLQAGGGSAYSVKSGGVFSLNFAVSASVAGYLQQNLVKPVCGYIVYSSPNSPSLAYSSIATDGVTTYYNTSTSTVTCTSTHLTDFVVSMSANTVAASSPSPSPSTAPKGAVQPLSSSTLFRWSLTVSTSVLGLLMASSLF